MEDPLAHLSVEARRSLAGLVGIQLKQTDLQSQFKREVWELERKVCGHMRPVMVRIRRDANGFS